MGVKRGIFVLIGGFVTHLTLGTGFSYGNMSPYIISYLHSLDGHPDVTSQDAIWGFAMAVFGQGSLMYLGGILYGKIGPRITSYIGSVIASLGVLLTYFTIQNSMAAVSATYGLMFGLGISIAYVPSLTAAMEWFPNRKGLVNGIIVGGFGLGSFIFTQVQTSYLNPDNERVDDMGYFLDRDLLNRIPTVFLLLGGIYLVCQFIGCALLTRPPKVEQEEMPLFDSTNVSVLSVSTTNLASTSELSYGAVVETSLGPERADKPERQDRPESDPRTFTEKKDTSETPTRRAYKPLEMLKCYQFYVLWLTFFFNNEILIYVNSMYKAYGQTFIKDDRYLAIVGAISAIFNSGGRVIWGLILDRTNYKRCMLVITACLCTLMATLGLTPHGGKIMFTIWIWAIFFFVAGTFVLMPTCITLTFGLPYAGINYGLLFTNTILSAPLIAILTQSFTTSIGWYGTFGMLSGFAACSFIITLFFKDIRQDS